MLQVLQTELPTTFRIHEGPHCEDLTRRINEFAQTIAGMESLPDKPRSFPWYPKNLGWHFGFSRRDLRKSAELKRFHEYITVQNDRVRLTLAVSALGCASAGYLFGLGVPLLREL